MSIFKKKQRTERQIKNRFYFALSLIGLMVLVCLVAPKGHKKQNEGSVDVASAMDLHLDTLAVATYGEGTTILPGTGKPEQVSEKTPVAQELEEAKLEYQLALQNVKQDNRYSQERAEQIKARVAELEEKAFDLPDQVTFYVRRVYVKLPDGSEMTGFQRTDLDLGHSQLVRMVERVKDVQAMSEKAEKILNNQNNE